MSRSAQVLPSRLLILLMALASVFLLFSTRVQADQPVETVSYSVEAGDTLWDIAADATPEGESIRATLIVLREINDLVDTTLRPGQRLEVPVLGTGSD